LHSYIFKFSAIGPVNNNLDSFRFLVFRQAQGINIPYHLAGPPVTGRVNTPHRLVILD
jgi:hypothetical protein